MASAGALIADASPRRISRSDSGSSLQKGGAVADPVDKEKQILGHEIARDEEEVEHDRQRRHTLYAKFRPYILALTAAVILGWWISSTVLEKTRHRWFVSSLHLSYAIDIDGTYERHSHYEGSFKRYGPGSSCLLSRSVSSLTASYQSRSERYGCSPCRSRGTGFPTG